MAKHDYIIFTEICMRLFDSQSNFTEQYELCAVRPMKLTHSTHSNMRTRNKMINTQQHNW